MKIPGIAVAALTCKEIVTYLITQTETMTRTEDLIIYMLMFLCIYAILKEG